MKLFNSEQLSKWQIVDYGFTTQSIPLSVANYNHWVNANDHLPLTYLEGERQQKRQDLKVHWPDYASAIVFLFSYHKAHHELTSLYNSHPDWNGLKLASYTQGFEGHDYHNILKERLLEIGEVLKEINPDLEFKLTLDTHPVLERDLAYSAGLGWFGKNSMLINREHGSFFILGSLLLNKVIHSENDNSQLETDHCGQCTLCVEACPTEAIDPVTRTIKAHDCISTFTIEQFKLDSLASEKMTLKSGTIFGCDICQDVCPWNKRVDRLTGDRPYKLASTEQKRAIDFFLLRDVKLLSNELEAMTEGAFKREFEKTSFFRSGRRGLLKNIRFYLKELNIFS
jgi:epoxyqueuosine reductase